MIAALAVPQVVAVTSDTSKTTITLEQALQIALSENATVQVADKEIEVKGYSRKGTYAALFPQISASGLNRTLKKL